MPFDLVLAEVIRQAEMRPAIVRPFDQMEETTATRLREEIWPQVEHQQRALAEWQEKLAKGRAVLSELFAEVAAIGAASDDELQPLDLGITKIEESARATAAEFDGVAATFRRQQRASVRLGSEARRWMDKIAHAALLGMETELEDRGDFILFLKAWRADLAGEHLAGSPSFTDAKELTDYLKGKIA